MCDAEQKRKDGGGVTGLEHILRQIQQQAEENAAGTLQQAREECAKISEQAHQAAAQREAALLEDGRQRQREQIARGESAARLSARKQLLETKLSLIDGVLRQAEEELCSLREEVYFPVLVRLAVKNALPGEGELLLSKRDLKRLPEDFERQLNRELPQGSSLRVSLDTRGCRGGFVLSYGGIEVNCRLEAVFAARREELQDLVNEILFGDET